MGIRVLSIETAGAFLLASVVLALVPGPDNIFVLTQSALQGRGAGLTVVLGLCTGLIVHTTAVALGVAVIFQASATAFTVLKLLGGGYLLYLAWQAFRTASTTITPSRSRGLGLKTLYLRGIIMNVTNPKVSIFFLAFLPQFADPGRGSLSSQIMALGGLFIIATLLVFGSIALLAGWLGGWLNRSAGAQRVMNWIAGAVFMVLALKLVTTERE